MTITYNKLFRNLLIEYNLPDNLVFSASLPPEVQTILSDQILKTELGITLKSFSGLYKATESWDNQSFIEDNENHFHVDSYIEPPDSRKAFMLAVKTLTLLADKFDKANMKGIRFFLSFMSPDLDQPLAEINDMDKNEHFISDRLSFHTRRAGEEVVAMDELDKSNSALLVIDI